MARAAGKAKRSAASTVERNASPHFLSCPTCSTQGLLLYFAAFFFVLAGGIYWYAGVSLALLSFTLPWLENRLRLARAGGKIK